MSDISEMEDKLQDTTGGFKDYMIPRLGDSYVNIPITFDYSGGRGENNYYRNIIAWILVALIVLGSLGILFGRSTWGLFQRSIVLGIYFTVMSLILRFIVMREGRLRKEYYKHMDTDFQLSSNEIWGIFEIDDYGMNVCHYRNGRIGVFFYLEKGVIVGLDPQAEYNNYEAIAEALRVAAEKKATVIHIDHMAYNGKDPRLQNIYRDIASVKNPELRALNMGITLNLEENLREEISSFDVYCVLMSSTESQYEEIVQSIIDAFLQGNYVGYSILGKEQLQKLTIDLFNLDNFSVIRAMKEALQESVAKVAVPIHVAKDGVVTKLNKTLQEQKEYNEELRKAKVLLEKEQRRRSQELKKAKKRAKTGEVKEKSILDEEVKL